MNINYKELGKQIKRCRTEKHITQAELAEMVDKSSVYISNIETASRKPALPVLVAIANALGVSIDRLLYGSSSAVECCSQELFDLFSDCSCRERVILTDTIRVLKKALRENS